MTWDFNMTDGQGDRALAQDRHRLSCVQRLDIQAEADGNGNLHIKWRA